MDIRKSTHADIPDIESIIERTLPGYDIFPAYWTELNYLLKEKDHMVYSADDGIDVVGFIHGYENSPKGNVEYLAIDPDYQGEGLGTTLLSTLAEDFKKRGLVQMSLVPANGSDKFYRRLGFERDKSLMVSSPDTILRKCYDSSYSKS